VITVLGNDVPRFLWTKVFNTTTYLLNKFSICANLRMTLLEKYIGIKLDLSHLRIFGFITHVHVDKENRNKLELGLHVFSWVMKPLQKIIIVINLYLEK
jgi:hypothetical protein